MTFNDCLKKYDPEGKLTRAQIDYIEKFYVAGRSHKVEAIGKHKEATETILEYYNKLCGRNISATPSNCAIVAARMNEGYKLEQFISVCDAAWKKWESWSERKKQFTFPVLFGSAHKMDKRLLWHEDAKTEALEEEVKPKSDGWQEVGF